MNGEDRLFPYFPKPEDSETVYSIFCRCNARSGPMSTHILKELTGQCHKHSLLSALPGYLARLSVSIPYGHPWRDAGIIVSVHTALPYFIYFDSASERERLYGELAHANSSRGLASSLGIAQNRGGAAPPHPRYCTTCAATDRKNLGFACFWREHQLPSIALCWKHGTALMHGCGYCGPYPINGKAFSMPGKCRCTNGATPLQAFDNLPTNLEPLHWLACQAAFMVNSNGSRCENIRAVLRSQIGEKNFARGSQLKYGLLADAIEERYGKEVLKWLGLPVWTEGRPAAWLRRLFCRQLDGVRRSPSILFLLIIGILFESVSEFEDAAEESLRLSLNPSRIEEESYQSLQKEPQTPPEVPWAKDLYNFLQSGKCDLRVISKKFAISRCRVIEEVRLRGWRVPLSPHTRKKLGEETIYAIGNELRQGGDKNEIERRYGCSQWALDAIVLDEPGLNAAYKLANNRLRHDKHRNCLTDYLLSKPHATRTDIFKELSGTYDYLITHDKSWFFSQIVSLSAQSRTGKRGCYKDWPTLDQNMTQEINRAFDEMFAPGPKPVRAAQTTILKRVKFLPIYMANSDRLPLVTKILTQRSESQKEFYIRRIKWAIGRMVDNNVPISVDKLRRVASMRVHLVRGYRQLVIEYSRELNATIHSNSFFA